MPEPLAAWYPNLADVPAAMRLTADDGSGRNAIRADDFRVSGSYVVSGPVTDLVEDGWTDAAQTVAYIDGERAKDGSSLHGYVVDFEASARETTGQVIMGAGQVRLLVTNPQTGESKDVYPIAAVAQSDAKDVEYVRFRYDAKDVFLASLGGATQTKMAFEFLVPPNKEPRALYLRNVRVDALPEEKAYNSVRARDREVRTGAIVGISAGGLPDDLIDDNAEVVANDQDSASSRGPTSIPEFQARTRLRKVLQKGTFSGLTLGSKNEITGGEAKIPLEAVGRGGLERTLQVREFAVTPDTIVVQLDVGADTRTSLLGRVVASAERLGAPALIDSNGQRYDALGYVYEDREILHVRYTPGNPIRALRETPQLARTRRDQRLELVFRPTRGVEIARFVVGNRVVTEFNPPILLNQNQSNK